MGKLRDILIDRMVGDMSQVFTFKNASKPIEELNKMTMPKVDHAEKQIKDLMLQITTESRDHALPIAYIEQKIREL